MYTYSEFSPHVAHTIGAIAPMVGAIAPMLAAIAPMVGAIAPRAWWGYSTHGGAVASMVGAIAPTRKCTVKLFCIRGG